ncbi:methionine ABC transporter ATP-binding protein [Evansella sp. LMS18]|jgi:D-methionine transport system ATP-binding protein|uniref:methionine ABC transporter ATP-binding protein n=1 Tax=Evansella sp. LMS18 TaxID=2924033 RepID=UPI0020D01CDB|nr:methionine ABC transporter ATP-binding protein [Evansella sp. LMS18]UTR08891.1 methionine ABC transporter ATP-binding protein [Evansella sp. LMS18]
MIVFDKVSKVFGEGEEKVAAVKDVSLEVEKGDIYGVIGFSGAGKSTLIRCVNLLERPTTGKVLINGEDITEFSPAKLRDKRKNIGMIFQHFNLAETKTVFANVAIPLQLAKVPKEEVKTKVTELLEFVGLGDKADQYPDQLSGGQKQRIGIARALATSPEILLCDEATSALDPQTTGSILKLLKKVNRELNITILMITHEMHVIRQICNKVAVMENGELIESGSVFDVFSKPQAKTTRNFVNSVMQDDIPQSILNMLAPEDKHSTLYRILFEGGLAGKPVLSSIARKYDLDVNVLHGHITELQDKPFGNLIVQFYGQEENIRKATAEIGKNLIIKEVERNGD